MLEKILVIEANTDARSRFYEIFYSLGYEVTCVPTAKEAQAALTEKRFSFIILSDDLPDEKAMELANKIRIFDKDAEIIVLSAAGAKPEDGEVDEQLRIRARIKKDFSSHLMMKELLQIIREGAHVNELKKNELQNGVEILVVDDNDEVRRMLELFLSKRGYNVRSAFSGEDALNKIKLEKPRLVFLDVRMPGMDGLLVLRQIKRLDESIKVVMLTSVEDEYIVTEAEKEGACDYMIKPCDLQRLDTLITALLL